MPARSHDRIFLLALTVIYFGLMTAGGSNVRIAFQVPHDPAIAGAFVTQHGGAIRWGSFLELVSAIPLGLFMAVSLSRLRVLDVRTAGEQIAALGATATTMMIAGSAMATWSLTRPGIAAAPGAVAALQALGFDGGGPGFAVFFGLFIVGLSVLAAASKLTPRWLMWFGMVIAAAGELSSLTLANFTAGYFIPVVRFLSIFWMLALAMNLPVAVPARGEGEIERAVVSTI